MKKKVVLRADLKALRQEKGLSLISLAEQVYSTDTTLFRAERAGFMSDESLAKSVADFFGIPHEEFYECIDESGKGYEWWNRQVQRVRRNRCLPESGYYVCFLTVYNAHHTYSVAVPSYWKSTDGDLEIRGLRLYGCCPELEGLRDTGIPYGVANEDIDVDFFFHSLEENRESVLLIKKEATEGCFFRFKEEYSVAAGELFDRYGFKDCVWI